MLRSMRGRGWFHVVDPTSILPCNLSPHLTLHTICKNFFADGSYFLRNLGLSLLGFYILLRLPRSSIATVLYYEGPEPLNTSGRGILERLLEHLKRKFEEA
ncbi:unnamed protein product, partial [Choristocarpus tenellus]